MLIRPFFRFRRWFFANEARVFSRATRREKWLWRRRLSRRWICYVMILLSIFFLLIPYMDLNGTIFENYLERSEERRVGKECRL